MLSRSIGVLHLLAPARFGGLERVVQCLSRGQMEAGHGVTVAAVGAREEDVEPFLAWFRRHGIPSRHLQVPDRRYQRERRLVGTLCAELEPDVVHTHGYRADVVDAGVARAARIPTVTTVHGFTGTGLRNRVYEWLQRQAFRRFDAVVAVSRPQVSILRDGGVAGERIHLVPNALDAPEAVDTPERARERLGVRPDVFHVGWVGRLSPEKGPDVLLEALARLPRRAVVVSFVGEGPLAGPLARRADDTGLASMIRWHGTIPDAASLLRAFDVVVLSSRTEGTPMVLLEAMHAGVPIVATRVGGIPDVVSPEDALLVPPDDPEALGAALDDVRLHPARAGARARSAHRRVLIDHGLQTWVERYDGVYEEVVNG